jgi:hypothetical protein
MSIHLTRHNFNGKRLLKKINGVGPKSPMAGEMRARQTSIDVDAPPLSSDEETHDERANIKPTTFVTTSKTAKAKKNEPAGRMGSKSRTTKNGSSVNGVQREKKPKRVLSIGSDDEDPFLTPLKEASPKSLNGSQSKRKISSKRSHDDLGSSFGEQHDQWALLSQRKKQKKTGTYGSQNSAGSSQKQQKFKAEDLSPKQKKTFQMPQSKSSFT